MKAEWQFMPMDGGRWRLLSDVNSGIRDTHTGLFVHAQIFVPTGRVAEYAGSETLSYSIEPDQLELTKARLLAKLRFKGMP